MIKLTTEPNELGTAVFTLAFTDSTDAVITPTALAWQLMKSDGTVVQPDGTALTELSFANGVFTGTFVTLTCTDLILFASDDKKRIFAIEALYDSDAGTDLCLKDEVQFKIHDLVSQS